MKVTRNRYIIQYFAKRVKYSALIIIKSIPKKGIQYLIQRKFGQAQLCYRSSFLEWCYWVGLTVVQNLWHEDRNKAENPSKLVCKSSMGVADKHNTEPQGHGSLVHVVIHIVKRCGIVLCHARNFVSFFISYS